MISSDLFSKLVQEFQGWWVLEKQTDLNSKRYRDTMI